MSWNIRQIYHDDCDSPYIALHEVYYSSTGEIEQWTVEAIQLVSETPDELRWYLSACEQALHEPLLILSDLEKDLKERT